MPLRHDRLREIREKRNLTQDELAKRVRMSLRQYGRYERNATNPTVEMITRIAKELDISIDYLAGLTDTPRSFIAEADLTEDEAELIGSFRRGDTKTLFDLFTEKVRENIPAQTIIPRRKKKTHK